MVWRYPNSPEFLLLLWAYIPGTSIHMRNQRMNMDNIFRIDQVFSACAPSNKSIKNKFICTMCSLKIEDFIKKLTLGAHYTKKGPFSCGRT